MPDRVVPEDVRQFILASIDSVAQMEALMLLRVNAGSGWTAAAIAQRLYITEAEAVPLLDRLCVQRIVAMEAGEYVYRPAEALAEIVARAAESYARHLVPVTHLIHTRPRTRIHEFAEAFRLRKDS